MACFYDSFSIDLHLIDTTNSSEINLNILNAHFNLEFKKNLTIKGFLDCIHRVQCDKEKKKRDK